MMMMIMVKKRLLLVVVSDQWSSEINVRFSIIAAARSRVLIHNVNVVVDIDVAFLNSIGAYCVHWLTLGRQFPPVWRVLSVRHVSLEYPAQSPYFLQPNSQPRMLNNFNQDQVKKGR